MVRKTIITVLLLLVSFGVEAQSDTTHSKKLKPISIRQRRAEGITKMSGAINGNEIGQEELFRAACCNLAESFVSNPSVDVNYNDAAVGTRQIKLLGLSGQYVQMLLENMPVSLGAAMPYSLGYIPGAWMKSISVSKGASSVKNGPQSITGQINVEYLKPEDSPALHFNLYGDSHFKIEANAMGNLHIGKHMASELLAHYEKGLMSMDENDDGWNDSPVLEQLHLQNRWKYQKGHYIMHAGVGFLSENREGGQIKGFSANPYQILIESQRVDGYMKHAILFDRNHNTNVAFLASGSLYNLDGSFGLKSYADQQQSVSIQLILEHDYNSSHNISAGLGWTADHIEETLPGITYLTYSGKATTEEQIPGAYIQYTYKPSYKLTAMAGLRTDYSTLYDRTYLTPRLHLKWTPADWTTLRISSGKGYRTPMPIAENHYLLTSGRSLTVESQKQEEAWNSGINMTFYIPVKKKTLTVNAEYYYTDFINQAVVDYDSDPTKIIISDLAGKSFSHTLQVDANYDLKEDLNIQAAFRYNHVRCTYGSQLLEKPLQSRFKGLVTLSWKPMMELWQFDVTLQLNGSGRIPNYIDAEGTLVSGEEFPAYPQLNLQITREFRHFSLYIGGENLTNYRQPSPVINAANPWSNTFDPTLVWGPVHGIMAYAGLRLKIGKEE